MARSPWDYGAWSSETKTIAGVAAVVAFVLFWLLDSGWLIALILAVLVFLAVVWWRQRGVVDAPPAYVASPARPVTPVAPVAPVVAPEPELAPEPAPEPVRFAAVDETALASTAAMQAIQPRRLDAPRDGIKDDLKKIKGVGPKLEALLNSHGYWHFDQVANWSDDEVVWIDGALEGFNGRASRDDWVGQAKILAAGGESEFSRRVDKGEVY